MTSRRSSGSMRAESAVEPTRSENITVTWRRSARSSGGALGATGRGRCVNGWRLAARIATQSSDGIEQLTPVPECGDAKLLQVLCVRLGRTVSSISFSRNAASYFPRPRLRSQTTMSMGTPGLLLAAYHPASGTERAYSGVGVGKSSEKGNRRCGRASRCWGHCLWSPANCSSALRWLKASLRLPPCMIGFMSAVEGRTVPQDHWGAVRMTYCRRFLIGLVGTSRSQFA